MIIFSVGSVICGVASSSKMLIGGRAIQGAGAAGLVNGAFTVIAACAPPEKKPSKLSKVVSPSLSLTMSNSVHWGWHGLVDHWPGYWADDRRCSDRKGFVALV